VKTAPGATAVQIVCSSHRGSRDIEHIGSAHGDAELLKAAARRGASRADGETYPSPAAIAERHGLS
jgi:hypothetical protein